MKKVFAIILMISILTSMFALAVSAELLSAEKKKVQSLVVFGDSISTGYGLEGNLYTRASYVNTVAQALGLSSGHGYVNYAVDGYTSTNILATAKQKSADVAGADLIILTCGGNDVLGNMLSIALSATGSTNLVQAVFAMMNMKPADLNAKLYSDANKAKIDTALNAYRTNMTVLVEYLRKTAPDAQIVFLTQYNPLSGVALAGALDAYAEDVIGRLNTIMVEVVKAGDCEIIDTHAVMVGKGLELSNIMSSDIHPNAAGHAAMAEMVKEYLNIPDETVTETTTSAEPESPTEPEETSEEPEETTEEPEETTEEMTTTLPEMTTKEPEATTKAPEATTKAPEATTKASEATTKAPEATTKAPEATTKVPEVTTKAPEATTKASETTTKSSETATETSETTTAVEITTAVTVATETTDVPTEDIPDEPEEKSSALPLIIGASLLVIGGGAVGVAFAIRKKF